jgi:hypothetical protein
MIKPLSSKETVRDTGFSCTVSAHIVTGNQLKQMENIIIRSKNRGEDCKGNKCVIAK